MAVEMPKAVTSDTRPPAFCVVDRAASRILEVKKMLITSIDQCAMAEFSNAITSVAFFQGCDMNCVFCQNPDLIPKKSTKTVDMDAEVAFIALGVINVEWVSFSGGEPLVQEDYNGLHDLARRIEAAGRKLNLDTNGDFSLRQKRERLYALRRYLDCVSIDIKEPGNQFYLTYMRVALGQAQLIPKARFRMVMYKNKPVDVKKYAMDGMIQEIQLINNSGKGKGAGMEPATEDEMKKVSEDFEQAGILVKRG